MKQLICYPLLIGFLLLSMLSCNDKLDLIGDYEETAVIYGLLDSSDSIHVIKITRTFIGSDDQFATAQNPDSSYFQSLRATVTEHLPDGSTGRTWQLFDTIVNTKETDGIFYAPEQKLYAFYSGIKDNSEIPTYEPLISYSRYDLKIIANYGEEDAFEVFGSTELISGVSTNAAAPQKQYVFAQDAFLLGVYAPFEIGVNRGNGQSVETKLTVSFSEFTPTDTVWQTFEWQLGAKDADEHTGSAINFSGEGELFYDLIVQNCSNTQGIYRRNLESIDLEIAVGSYDLFTYSALNDDPSPIAQSRPKFTNLTATNGHTPIGIFSSRNVRCIKRNMIGSVINNRCLNQISTYELCNGPKTYELLFCSQHPTDIATSQSWACN